MKKKKKGWLIAVILVAVIVPVSVGAVACMRSISGNISMMTSSNIETVTLEKQDLYSDISVSGTVESKNMVKVTSLLSAKVESLNVELGSEVKQGDILCVFDSSDLQAEYDALYATIQKSDSLSENNHKINVRNLDSAQKERDALVAQAKQGIDDAVAARDNAEAKFNQLCTSCNALVNEYNALIGQMNAAAEPEIYDALAQEAQLKLADLRNAEAMRDAQEEQLPTYRRSVQVAQDTYNSTVRNAESAVQSCQDALDAEQFSDDPSVRRQLDKLQTQIEACVVKAPASGIITSLNIAQGSIPTTDALMTIEDAGDLKISVQVNETDILKLQEGMRAIVKTTATGDQTFDATVIRVVNIFNGSKEMGGGYSAEISIDDKNSGLLIGMTAKAKIVLAEKKDVLAVPYEAIFTNDDGDSCIYAVRKSGDGVRTAHAVKVTPGMESSYYVEITGEEIEEGMEIVISADNVNEGDVIPMSGFEQMMLNGENAE